MNYRHAYHAGNFADVFKHLVLVYVVNYLSRKERGFRFIDTHAGTGMYDLGSIEAQKTGEWRDGIGRLLTADKDQGSDAGRDRDPGGNALKMLSADPIIKIYLDVIRSCNADTAGGPLKRYPGSPCLVRALLRAQDAMVVNELHPRDFDTLTSVFARDRQVKVLNLDGWLVPKSTLPPKERRGVILIDPPFEDAGEFGRMARALTDGVRRFANGTYIFWYPIKDPRPIDGFKQEIARLKLERVIAAELFIRSPCDTDVLCGCGLMIHNPPFGLETWLEELLPALASLLGQSMQATYRLHTIV